MRASVTQTNGVPPGVLKEASLDCARPGLDLAQTRPQACVTAPLSRADRSPPSTLIPGREPGSPMTIEMIVALIGASVVAYAIANRFRLIAPVLLIAAGVGVALVPVGEEMSLPLSLIHI